MPITILNKKFTQQLGAITNFYQGNVGDKITAEIEFKTNISVNTANGHYLTLNPVDNIITWSSGDFEVEGFRVGDSINFVKYTSGGAIISQWTAVCNSVNGSQIDVTTIPSWINASNGEIILMQTITFGSNAHKREGLIVDVNHVQNGNAGNEFSLIDGDVTRFSFDLRTMNGTGNQFGSAVGNQSGQFVESIQIFDETIAKTGNVDNNEKYYRLKIIFIQSGLYQPSYFDYANCLKLFSRLRFQSKFGEPFDNLIEIYNDDGDTGYFGEAFNLGVVNSTLIQSVGDLSFDSIMSGQIIVNGATPLAIGCSYIPDDETYYKNKPESQRNLGMTIQTSIISLGSTNVPITSPLNPSGAGYIFFINSVVSVGTTRTINFQFMPNPAFTTFMESRDVGDRLFRIWARIGNTNHLVFENQLISNPPIAGNIDMVVSEYLDHSQNYQNAFDLDLLVTYKANVEDDIAYCGKFRIDYFDNCDFLNAKIEAFNVVTNEKFTIQSNYFDISSIPQIAGKHILNEIQPVNSQFLTTSEKRECILTLDPLIDDVGAYGVKIYMPILYRWETWIEQLNANNDFYPDDKTKNWVPFGTFPNWILRTRIELSKNALQYIFTQPIDILDYDSEPLIDQTIELFVDSTNQNVQIVTDGLLMRVVGTHTLLNGSSFDPLNTFGMITIEPTESSPRWMCSSVVPFDNNINNPLTPMSTLFCDMTFPVPDVCRLECFFDPTKIDLSNGVKFTTKIKTIN